MSIPLLPNPPPPQSHARAEWEAGAKASDACGAASFGPLRTGTAGPIRGTEDKSTVRGTRSAMQPDAPLAPRTGCSAVNCRWLPFPRWPDAGMMCVCGHSEGGPG